ncbi:hypothetical protein ACFOY2_05585 [Nonomuraea purpurea]|uniref:HTH iclR-type domain-containing protein n=1 Tax=Nonomuraea purpurea TaxID=1849276 RepID=A0ABV8G1Z7_9ACTN
MKPPFTVSPDEAVPSPAVPEDVRRPLLALAAQGVTTDAAATELGLTAREAMRYLQLLRVSGHLTLRPTEDGRGAEWWKTTKTRRSS